MPTDKSQGRRIGWLCLDTYYPFDYHVFRIRRDRMRLLSLKDEG